MVLCRTGGPNSHKFAPHRTARTHARSHGARSCSNQIFNIKITRASDLNWCRLRALAHAETAQSRVCSHTDT